MLKKSFLLLNIIALTSTALAGKIPLESLSLKQLSYKAIEASLNNQIQAADENYFVGEWPTRIQSTLIPIMAGVGRPIGKNEEATGFTTAAVINILAQTYLENSDLKHEAPLSQIPASIQNGINSLTRYQQGSTFNFYPPRMNKGVEVRRPINMTLLPIWHGFTNVPNDSDTSSSVFSAKMYNAKINGDKYKISENSLTEFSKFRDVNRKAQFYNRFNNLKNSGGFLTWLHDENDPNMPRFYFASSSKGARIPFNRNDVDCVVNANILRMLALAGKPNQIGRTDACEMLNKAIANDEHKDCGIYYPNTLNLSYAIASSEKAGETCITEQSHKRIVDKILAMQLGDGSWTNEGNIWQDPTLTTAYAMASLLHYANPREDRVHTALVYGVHSLLKNARQKDTQIYWDADHYFTATAIARSLIMWESKAYTNAIVGEVLLKMSKEFPNYTTSQYLKLNFQGPNDY
ncbi:MAG: hypothetical protein H7328_08295 [Bdellovibrio sp.]|nr:hypothetical protein [Bdellovibrio sp.]